MSDDKIITEDTKQELAKKGLLKVGIKPKPLVSADTVADIIRRLKKVPVKTPPKVDPKQQPLFPENPNNLPVPVTPGKAPQAPTPVVPKTAPLPTIPNPTNPLPKTPVVVLPKPVDALPKTEPSPQTQPLPKTTTDKKAPPPPSKPPVDNTGGKGGKGRRFGGLFAFGGARGRDLRTHITGTGVREEYISEEEERFKKFKVIYIINGSEKTNVYRYKGKDTFAKARVMRQLRERGAGSIRFMQYESFDSDIFEHEIVRGEDGRYYDDEGNSSSSISKSARRYMVGDNYHPKKNYGYGYKDNGRRKALPRSTEKIYHAVSFQQKDAAKEEGMRWDPDVKKWYHSSPERSANSKFKKLDEVMPGERTATSDNTKRLRKLIRKVLKKGKLKR